MGRRNIIGTSRGSWDRLERSQNQLATYIHTARQVEAQIAQIPTPSFDLTLKPIASRTKDHK